jgi:hypothetical protein
MDQQAKSVQQPMYADQMHSIVSPYGFTLLFGQVGIQGPMTAIGMSPQHLKAMLAVLNHQMQEYEKQYGSIALDPKTQEEFLKKATKQNDSLAFSPKK